jgi:CheY-like chemotaxis protein
MRRVANVVALATGAVFYLSSPLADACGDKLLSIARGIRLQQVYKAQHPASILLYVGTPRATNSTRDRNAMVQMGILYMSLRRAGHRIEVAENADELDQALRNASFDLALADLRDVAAVAERIAAPSRLSAYPVLYKPNKTDLAAAQERFELVLRTPTTSTDNLEAIDRLLGSGSGEV